MDNLMSSFHYSELLSEDNSKEASKSTEVLFQRSELSEIRRCKSSGPELTSLSTKPPVETKDTSEGISMERAKSTNSKTKKSKSRLKTWGKIRGMKVLKGIRKNASMRNLDVDKSPELTEQQFNDTTEASSGETAQSQSVSITPPTKFGMSFLMVFLLSF